MWLEECKAAQKEQRLQESRAHQEAFYCKHVKTDTVFKRSSGFPVSDSQQSLGITSVVGQTPGGLGLKVFYRH